MVSSYKPPVSASWFLLYYFKLPVLCAVVHVCCVFQDPTYFLQCDLLHGGSALLFSGGLCVCVCAQAGEGEVILAAVLVLLHWAEK